MAALSYTHDPSHPKPGRVQFQCVRDLRVTRVPCLIGDSGVFTSAAVVWGVPQPPGSAIERALLWDYSAALENHAKVLGLVMGDEVDARAL